MRGVKSYLLSLVDPVVERFTEENPAEKWSNPAEITKNPATYQIITNASP